MNKSEQELKEDEADALADLRQAVKDEVSDEWLLGFVRQYPFRTRSTALNLSHEQLSKIAEDLGLPSAHVVDCVMRQAILAASQPAQGVGLTDANDLNLLDSAATWLMGHSNTTWARDFEHRTLMQMYATRLRQIRAILARQTAPTQAEPSYWNSQRKMIERAIIGLRDGWATRKDADDALAALGTAPQQPAVERDDETAVVAHLPDIHAKLREAFAAGAMYHGPNGIDAEAYNVAERMMRQWDLPDAPSPAPVAQEGEALDNK